MNMEAPPRKEVAACIAEMYEQCGAPDFGRHIHGSSQSMYRHLLLQSDPTPQYAMRWHEWPTPLKDDDDWVRANDVGDVLVGFFLDETTTTTPRRRPGR